MYDYKKEQLLKYLQYYLSKRDLRMKIVLIRIVDQLKENKPISVKQFNSIIKFLEREPKFISMDRDGIRNYFDHLITPTLKKEKPIETITLCEFFV